MTGVLAALIINPPQSKMARSIAESDMQIDRQIDFSVRTRDTSCVTRRAS